MVASQIVYIIATQKRGPLGLNQGIHTVLIVIIASIGIVNLKQLCCFCAIAMVFAHNFIVYFKQCHCFQFRKAISKYTRMKLYAIVILVALLSSLRLTLFYHPDVKWLAQSRLSRFLETFKNLRLNQGGRDGGSIGLSPVIFEGKMGRGLS